MTAVTLTKNEVTRVLVRAAGEGERWSKLYGSLMYGWLQRTAAREATYDLEGVEAAFVSECLPERKDLRP